jgi:hypothetical protein
MSTPKCGLAVNVPEIDGKLALAVYAKWKQGRKFLR